MPFHLFYDFFIELFVFVIINMNEIPQTFFKRNLDLYYYFLPYNAQISSYEGVNPDGFTNYTSVELPLFLSVFNCEQNKFDKLIDEVDLSKLNEEINYNKEGSLLHLAIDKCPEVALKLLDHYPRLVNTYDAALEKRFNPNFHSKNFGLDVNERHNIYGSPLMLAVTLCRKEIIESITKNSDISNVIYSDNYIRIYANIDNLRRELKDKKLSFNERTELEQELNQNEIILHNIMPQLEALAQASVMHCFLHTQHILKHFNIIDTYNILHKQKMTKLDFTIEDVLCMEALIHNKDKDLHDSLFAISSTIELSQYYNMHSPNIFFRKIEPNQCSNIDHKVDLQNYIHHILDYYITTRDIKNKFLSVAIESGCIEAITILSSIINLEDQTIGNEPWLMKSFNIIPDQKHKTLSVFKTLLANDAYTQARNFKGENIMYSFNKENLQTLEGLVIREMIETLLQKDHKLICEPVIENSDVAPLKFFIRNSCNINLISPIISKLQEDKMMKSRATVEHAIKLQEENQEIEKHCSENKERILIKSIECKAYITYKFFANLYTNLKEHIYNAYDKAYGNADYTFLHDPAHEEIYITDCIQPIKVSDLDLCNNDAKKLLINNNIIDQKELLNNIANELSSVDDVKIDHNSL